MIQGIDQDAPIVSRHRRLIKAPRQRVWDLHVDIARWPSWQTDVTDACLDRDFAPGATFRWSAKGIEEPITSTVHAVEDGRRTLWGGPANGIAGLHEWRFADDGGGTLVETDESWSGASLAHQRDAMQQALDASLERWLDFMAARLR